MRLLKSLLITAALFALSSPANAIVIDFKALANGGGALGESAWNTLSFNADGSHSMSNAFLDITGTNGSASYAYMDSGNAGLGVCGTLHDSTTANTKNPGSGANLCNPSSDDNTTNHGGTPESLHFVFDETVVIEKIWLNNNHDGDKSLLNDFVLFGVDAGVSGSTLLDNGGFGLDSVLDLGITANSFELGFDPSQLCLFNGTGSFSYNNCEFYVSKIEFSTIPEPGVLALLGLGIVSMGIARRRRK